MKMFQWVVYSFPTTLAYTCLCLGFTNIALIIYRLLEKTQYPPALHHYGVMLTDITGGYRDIAKAKSLIRRAADLGYKKSQGWNSEYSSISEESSEKLQHLFESMETPGQKRWTKYRPYLYLILMVFAVAVLIVEPVIKRI